MQLSILSGSRTGYVNRFHPADLPQQNSKTQCNQSVQKRKRKTGLECYEMVGTVGAKYEWSRPVGILKEHGG